MSKLSSADVNGFSGYNGTIGNCYADSIIEVKVGYSGEKLRINAFSDRSKSVKNCFTVADLNIFLDTLNSVTVDSINTYTFSYCPEGFKAPENAFYSEINFSPKVGEVIKNGESASIQAIRQFCMDNWDNSIWEMSLEKDPALK